MAQQHYIFGYGSLICSDSRSRTGISGDAHPVEVRGIQRRWSMHSPEWPATAVSAHHSRDHTSNGVFFAVDEENLSKFDAREQGYDRIQLPWHDVKSLNDQTLPTAGVLWAYVGHHVGEPGPDKPIMQSYLDVILNGCLDYSVEFAERFTQTTELWQHLVDDRHNPQYPRPLKQTDRHEAIDHLLHNTLPMLIRHRKRHRHD